MRQRIGSERTRSGAWLFVVLLAACDSEAVRIPSEVVVEIDAEEGIKQRIASLRVVVEGGGEGVDQFTQRTTRLDETIKPIDFPKRVAILPLRGDVARAFALTVTGFDASNALLSQARIISSYVPGEVRYARLLLQGGACEKVECTRSQDTCTNGSCIPAIVDAGGLSNMSNRPTPVFPPAVSFDAGPDANPSDDSGPERDTGTGSLDAGAEAGLEDAGGEAGLQAGDADAGPDAPPDPCANDASDPACACPSGFVVGPGPNGCVDENECASERTVVCGVGATDCANTLGSFQCTCSAGYAAPAAGAKCVDSDECSGRSPVDVCGAGATACANTPGSYACTCQAGFDGTGTTSCRDIIDCTPIATARCGQGATDCSDTPGSYVCTCEATRYVGTGSQGCRDRDECTELTLAAACGVGAEQCVNSPGNYGCSCRPSHALNPDQHSCRLRAWGNAGAIDNEAGNATWPAVAVDASDNGVAVWYQVSGAVRSVYAARFRVGGAWSAPAPIEQDANDAGGAPGSGYGPKLAMNAAGVAFAVWEQTDGTRTNIWANRFAGGTWGTAASIDSANGAAGEPAVAVDAAGNAFAVWYQSDGAVNRIWANRFTGTAWGTATIISTNATGTAGSQRVAVDAAGNAMAAWEQTDASGDSNIWANRFAGGAWGAASLIETTNPGHAWNPALAMDGAGNAIAVWYQQNPTRTHTDIWTNRYTAGGNWGSAMLLEQRDDGAASSAVAMDNAGNAIAIWYQYDGEWDSIWARRYSGGSWSSPMRIETQNVGNAHEASIGMDRSGNATVVWYQGDGERTDVWTNQFVDGSWGNATLVEGENGGTAQLPAVAVSSTGSAVAVWTRFMGNQADVWANRFE